MKKKWGILTQPPHFDMSFQVKVPPALAALHNFVMEYDPGDLDDWLDHDSSTAFDPNPGDIESFGELSQNAVTPPERTRSMNRRDLIAHTMWSDYLEELRKRGENV